MQYCNHCRIAHRLPEGRFGCTEPHDNPCELCGRVEKLHFRPLGFKVRIRCHGRDVHSMTWHEIHPLEAIKRALEEAARENAPFNPFNVEIQLEGYW